MTTRALGPLAGLHWLKRGINTGRHNPRAVFGAAAWVAMASLLPSLVQLLLLSLLQPGPNGSMAIAVAVTLLQIVLFPPLVGGFFRLIHAAEQGAPTRATDIFAPFHQPADARRMVGFGLVLTALYLAIAAVLLGVFGRGILDWYLQVAELSQHPPIDPKAIPPLPEGFSRVVVLGTLVGLFLLGVYAIGFGQVAVRASNVFAAFRDGVMGALKNLLPLLVLAVIGFFLTLALILAVGVVLAVIGVLGAMVHPMVAAALALPVYLVLLLVLYVVMFGVMYHLWRDVCSDAPAPSNPNEVAV